MSWDISDEKEGRFAPWSAIRAKRSPRTVEDWDRGAHFTVEAGRSMGELGLLGADLPEEGWVAAGFASLCVGRELGR